MLSTLLETIKSQFGSKSYWLGCMLPLILFLAANVLVADRHYSYIAKLIPAADAWPDKTMKYSAALALLLAVAYVLSTTTAVQLRMIEGTAGPFRWMSWVLRPAHARAMRKLDREFRKAEDTRDALEDSRKQWLDVLDHSAKAGSKQPPLPKGAILKAKHEMDGIVWRQYCGTHIAPDLVQRAVDKLSLDLAEHSVGIEGKLYDAYLDLQSAIQYAMDRYEFDVRRLAKRRYMNFPGVRPNAPDPPEQGISIEFLAPTAMGNIGRTMGTYSLVRYGMDLDIFWTRLQSSLQKDSKEYYAVLQDSKVQVDSMVMMFWLSFVFTVYWTAALVFWVPDATVKEFLMVSISGSVSVAITYVLACEAYRVFADVMRASVDLMRFQMLQSLHLPLPLGTDEEKTLWLRLGKATAFLDPEMFPYKHP